MRCRITEIKQLGRGMEMNLSVRLERDELGQGQCGDMGPCPHTIHAVVPHTPEFGQLQIGQYFDFIKSPDDLAKHLS